MKTTLPVFEAFITDSAVLAVISVKYKISGLQRNKESAFFSYSLSVEAGICSIPSTRISTGCSTDTILYLSVSTSSLSPANIVVFLPLDVSPIKILSPFSLDNATSLMKSQVLFFIFKSSKVTFSASFDKTRIVML